MYPTVSVYSIVTATDCVGIRYPTNYIIQRVSIAKYLSTNIIIWGAILALHAACHNFAGLVTVRTLLGVFEACCQPIFIVLSSMWYKREEQAQTVACWCMMNGGQQIVGGVLAYAFTNIPGTSPVKSWQALFMAYGIASVFWGIFVLVWMPDSPMRAKCWSEDKKLMVERVRSNQTGMQNKQFRKEQVFEALKDPQMWCFALIQIFTTLPTSGLGAFSNIIIMSFNFTTLQTQLLAMVLGAYLIIVLMSSAWIAKKTNQTVLVMAACHSVGFLYHTEPICPRLTVLIIDLSLVPSPSWPLSPNQPTPSESVLASSSPTTFVYPFGPLRPSVCPLFLVTSQARPKSQSSLQPTSLRGQWGTVSARKFS